MEPEIVILLSVLGGVILLGLFFLLSFIYAIKPGKSAAMEKYRHASFAHRGLWGDGVAENSMTAFRLARERGYGIELDIQLSRDGELVVFHDSTLLRMCGVEGRLADFTADELGKIRLGETSDCIPRFREVLELIDGAVPLLVEIKVEDPSSGICEKFIEQISDYGGEYIVESFHPIALKIIKKKRPDIVRGILSKRYRDESEYDGKPVYRLLENLMTNFYCRPQFIAYERTGHANRTLRFIRRVWKTPLLAWTVRSQAEEDEALSAGYDGIIFEGYLSDNK